MVRDRAAGAEASQDVGGFVERLSPMRRDPGHAHIAPARGFPHPGQRLHLHAAPARTPQITLRPDRFEQRLDDVLAIRPQLNGHRVGRQRLQRLGHRAGLGLDRASSAPASGHHAEHVARTSLARADHGPPPHTARRVERPVRVDQHASPAARQGAGLRIPLLGERHEGQPHLAGRPLHEPRAPVEFFDGGANGARRSDDNAGSCLSGAVFDGHFDAFIWPGRWAPNRRRSPLLRHAPL